MVAVLTGAPDHLFGIRAGTVHLVDRCADLFPEFLFHVHAAEIVSIAPAGFGDRLVVDKGNVQDPAAGSLEESVEQICLRRVVRAEHQRLVWLCFQGREFLPDLFHFRADLRSALVLHVPVRINIQIQQERVRTGDGQLLSAFLVKNLLEQQVG